MNTILQLLRNVSSNYLVAIVDGLIIVVLTPFVVHELGIAHYAVWIIIQTLAFYLGFLDLGVPDAQVQRHSVLQAQGRSEELGRLHGTVFVFFVGAGLVAVGLSIVTALLPSAELFDVPLDVREIYGWVLPLAGLTVLFSFAETAANGIFEGYQRYDLMNKIDIVLSLAEAVAVFLTVYAGYGLIGLALVKACRASLAAGLKLVTARRIFPAHAFPRFAFDHPSWRSIRSFSLWNSLNDLTTEGTAQLDKLLIPILLASVLVTPYSFVVMLAAMVFFVAEPITETFFPIAASRHGRGDSIAMGVLLKRGSKFVSAVTLPTTIVILCFGMAILDLWVGEEFTAVSPAVLWFTTLSFYFSTYFWTALSVLMGSGEVKRVFWTSVAEVAIVLILILMLVPQLGLTGLALAGLIGNVVIGFRFFVARACRIAGLDLWPVLRTTLIVPIGATLPALVLGAWFMQSLRPSHWFGLLLCVGATALLAFVSVLAVATTRWERARCVAILRRFVAVG